MTESQRRLFDDLLEEALGELPESFHELLEEVPLIVEDRPSAEILEALGLDPADPSMADEVCGLHSGLMLTERSVEHSGELPNQIHVFRRGVVTLAGGWRGRDAEDRVYEQIVITLLHEIGHEMGLDEDDLEELGYG